MPFSTKQTLSNQLKNSTCTLFQKDYSKGSTMFPKKGPDISPLKEQLKAILSFRLIHSAKTVLEKLFWLIISLGGTIYISYVFQRQFEYWNDNPVLKLKGSKPLSRVERPAITFCHKGAQRYALIERFVNYVDVNKDIPKEIFEIRNEVIKAQVYKIKNMKNPRYSGGLTEDVVDICSFRYDDEFGRWKELSGFAKIMDKTRKRCMVNIPISLQKQLHT